MPAKTVNVYYVTISPNPRKMHGAKAYACHKDVYQIGYIHKAVSDATRWCKKTYIPEIHFEFNQKLMIHAHLTMKLTQVDMARVQRSINDKLGSPTLSPDICCHICPEACWKPKKINPETGNVFQTWEEYCAKDNLFSKTAYCNCLSCKLDRDDSRLTAQIETGEVLLSNAATHKRDE